MATMPSLLDDLGEEVTGIMAPVSLCMAVTVLLVRLLNPEGASSSGSVKLASIAYQEESSDSSGKKLGGALLNAVIFVSVIGGMTVLLFLLFKYKCYKVIYLYMSFAIFCIFFILTGTLFIQVMQVINLHIDAFSLAYGLINFSVVGTLGLLFAPIPLLMKQVYLIWVGIIVAYIFTFIPEWTAWVILVFMALYDIAAVLIPGGPLKGLVELAIERKEDLPALIYEARPAGGRPYVRGWGNRAPLPVNNNNNNGVTPGGTDDGAMWGPAPRPVAEAAAARRSPTAAPNAVEMRRPTSRPESAGGGGDGVAVNGGWVWGPSQISPAAPLLPEAAAAPVCIRLGGGGGGGGGNASEADPVVALDTVRSFGSHQSRDLSHPQPVQQPRLLGTAGVAQGPRPVVEGLEREAGTWEALPSGSPADKGSPRGDTLRQRLSQVLSASDRRSRTALDSSSHTSQDPLIDPGSGERALQQPRTSTAVIMDTGPIPQASGSTIFGGNVVASTSSPSWGVNGTSYEGSSLKPLRPSMTQYLGITCDSVITPIMGVRAVPPALSQEQLAEAVRGSVHHLGEDFAQQPQLPGAAPLSPAGLRPSAALAAQPLDNEQRRDRGQELGGDALESDLPDAIKLGLGDFIFYSMLVGRAAMYDFMTVFSSYLAIIAGLGLTLLCLALYQKALPALPFSIALGVAFYFLTRITLEPFLVPMTVHLAYY